MEQPKGRFHKVCEFVKQTQFSVIIFKVNPNGFATYLKAREIADSMNIPCGWEIEWNNAHQAMLPFGVNRLEEPPHEPAPQSHRISIPNASWIEPYAQLTLTFRDARKQIYSP